MVVETDLTVVAHLTCVGATEAELRAIVRRLGDAGVRAILALRGDPEGGPDAEWRPTPGGLDRAEDLVRLVKEEGDFAVGVAAYPQRHRESADDDAGIKFFAAKCAAGADFAITQFFYDACDYARFVAAARAAGCDVPVLPGIMPVTSARQIERFPQLSGHPSPASSRPASAPPRTPPPCARSASRSPAASRGRCSTPAPPASTCTR